MARRSLTIPKDQSEALTNEQRIGVLLQHAGDNDSVFYFLSRQKPNIAAIDNDVTRKNLAELHEVVCPAFDALFRQRLMEQIRKVKCRYQQEVKLDQIFEQRRSSDDGTPMRVGEIPVESVHRFSLGIESMDLMMGREEETGAFGMPRGACLIFGASKGIGKTRLSVEIAAHVGSPNSRPDIKGNNGVLYIQNEESLTTFRSRAAKSWTNDHRIWVSSSDNFRQHQSMIDRLKPKLVMIDSMQDVRQARHTGGLVNMLSIYKQIAEDTGTSFWLISHLTTDGKIKGGSYPGHKVDIELIAKRAEEPGCFTVSCPEKNRYGATDLMALFRHTPNGVVSAGAVTIQ